MTSPTPNIPLPLRTIIYTRVSTEDQLEKYGLPSQLRSCREYAQARGFTVLDEITDDGISGTILARPGLDRVRKLVEEGHADCVLMFDVDRLSRELAHLLLVKPEIEKRAKLEFVASKFEDSPNGRMFFGIRGVIAQFEREQTRERTMRGKRERARSGLIVGGRTAYGYRYAAGKLIPEETSQAPTVREIFAWYDAGVSIRSIARQLRERGTSSWSGGTRWGHSTVHRILANETYAGAAYYGTHRREGALLHKRESHAERIGFVVPSLVPREQWERVQLRLAANPARGRATSRYLLRGLLYCGACGKRMSGNAKREHLSYRCNGRDTTLAKAQRCRESVSATRMDHTVWATLSQAFTEAGFLLSILSAHERELRGDVATQNEAAARLAKLRGQVQQLDRKERTCLAALLDPDLVEGQAAIKAEFKRVQQERSRVAWDLASVERANAQASNGATAKEWLEATVQAIREYIPEIESPEDRRAFVGSLVQRVDWDGDGGVKIACLFGPELSRSSSRYGQFQPIQVVLNARVA